REPFALLIVVPADAPADAWKPMLADASPDLPVFLSTAAARAAYAPGRGPLHFLIDEDGRIVATAGGLGDYLDHLAEKAEDLLDAIAPTEPRFAANRRQVPLTSPRAGESSGALLTSLSGDTMVRRGKLQGY